MKQRFAVLLKHLLMGGFFLATNVAIYAAQPSSNKEPEKVFYRYTNEQGVKVVTQTMPPQFVRNGYEIVALSGEVLKVIPPAPSAADVERVNKEKKTAKEQARADLLLRRTYSNAGEVDAAKSRNLLELRNNINILQANLISVKSQLKDQEAHAATIERNGQKVSDDVLKNITTLRTEEKDVTAQISQREIEFKAASDKFDQDKQRFIEISTPKQP